MTFRRELEMLINRFSKEAESDTPDYILANYLEQCLRLWNDTIYQRKTWYANTDSQSKSGDE